MPIFETAIEKAREIPGIFSEKVKTAFTSEHETDDGFVENTDQLEAQEGDAFGVEPIQPVTGNVNPVTSESLLKDFRSQAEGFLQDVVPQNSKISQDEGLLQEVVPQNSNTSQDEGFLQVVVPRTTEASTGNDGHHPVTIKRSAAVVYPQNTDIDDYILPNETQGLEAVTARKESGGFLEGLFGPKKTEEDEAMDTTEQCEFKRGDVAGTMDEQETCNTGPTSNAI